MRQRIEHTLAARPDPRLYQGVRNLSQFVSHDCGNRFLIELIQNAHDAHDPARTDGSSAPVCWRRLNIDHLRRLNFDQRPDATVAPASGSNALVNFQPELLRIAGQLSAGINTPSSCWRAGNKSRSFLQRHGSNSLKIN